MYVEDIHDYSVLCDMNFYLVVKFSYIEAMRPPLVAIPS